ncbi:MAG: ABC transporter ATP-binding protein, partial [Betaproteobacteria bacterium]|nr:ABC transporter ATP-binding protein [Betaproteobacteria bacterium]
MADLRIDQVSKHFGQTAAVQGLNLDVGNGEFFALLGPSGAGKTTTLRLVAGLETPDRGQVFIDGQDVTQRAPALRDVAFVFQQYSLYPHLSVYENLAFPLRSPLRKTPDLEIRAKVKEVASLLRIEDKLQNSATQL